VALLSVPYSRANAAGLLVHLADFYKKDIRDAQGIVALVSLLGLGAETEETINAAAALSSLSLNEMNKRAILDCGGTVALVALLGAGVESRAVCNALEALSHLSDGYHNRAAICAAGGIESIVTLLGAGAADSQFYEVALRAAKTLSNLAITDANDDGEDDDSEEDEDDEQEEREIKDGIRVAGGIVHLVYLLASDELRVVQVALVALNRLGSNNSLNLCAIREAGSIKHLVAQLVQAMEDQDYFAIEIRQSARLLRKLAFANNNDDILVSGGVGPLVDLLRADSDSGLAECAAVTLCRLFDNDANKIGILNALNGENMQTYAHVHLKGKLHKMLEKDLVAAEACGDAPALERALSYAKSLPEAMLRRARARLSVIYLEGPLKARLRSVGIGELPYEFKCPISLERMVDPVVASDGNTYERTAMEELFEMAQRQGIPPKSPLTREELGHTWFPNRQLKACIEMHFVGMMQVYECVAAHLKRGVDADASASPPPKHARSSA
jgi:hypothetical protein